MEWWIIYGNAQTLNQYLCIIGEMAISKIARASIDFRFRKKNKKYETSLGCFHEIYYVNYVNGKNLCVFHTQM